jgi:hypothetical protein
MSYMHPAAVEHLRKRWTRPDAYRFARPGTPEARPPWERVETASADVALAAAEQDAFEHELLHLRWLVKSMRLELALRRFQEKYSPDQPRVPAGNSDGGQWTDGGGSGAGRGSGRPSGSGRGIGSQPVTQSDFTGAARYSFGTLVGRARILGGGWMCFYKFGFGTVMVPGATNLGCATFMPSSGVSHGALIFE